MYFKNNLIILNTSALYTIILFVNIYTTMSELTNNDYKRILEFYNKDIPRSKRLLKIQA